MESWLPVVGYEGLYEVGDEGHIRSLPRRGTKGGLLVAYLAPNYPCVTLTRDARRRTVRVHHIVLEAFVGPRPTGLNGLHQDDDKWNNHLSNLRWDTQLENAADRYQNGGYSYNITHCPQEHEYTYENTYVDRNGCQICRTCRREDMRDRRRRGVSQ